MHGQCERARRWASAELDGELSSFERALLHDHLGRCVECREFSASVTGLTAALRAAPPEPFSGVEITRLRRRVHLPLARVAVAMAAVAAIGLGSILASVQLKGSAVTPRPLRTTPAIAGPDAVSQLMQSQLERQHVSLLANRPTRAVRGGRVVLEP